jgi:hypothetical protein
MDIKQSQPILKGLEYETAKDERDAEGSEASLRKTVSIVFDVRIDGGPNARDDACYQAHSDCKSQRVIDVMYKSTTDKGTGDVAKSADHGSPELATCKSRTASRYIIYGRTHPARVSHNLADRDEEGKCHREPNAYDPV